MTEPQKGVLKAASEVLTIASVLDGEREFTRDDALDAANRLARRAMDAEEALRLADALAESVDHAVFVSKNREARVNTALAAYLEARPAGVEVALVIEQGSERLRADVGARERTEQEEAT